MSKQFEIDTRRRRTTGVALVLTATALAACTPRILNLPPDGGVTVPLSCTAGADWLPSTPVPALDLPPTHPEGECGFYKDAYQRFLYATQPDETSMPALFSYATIDDVFTRSPPLAPGALARPGTHRGTSQRAWLGNVASNGLPEIVLDQDGHALYHGTHLNKAFVDFVNATGLTTARGVQNADPHISLPPGIVELKSAWKDIDAADGVAGDYSTFITTTAWVAHLSKDASGAIVEDWNHPRQIQVALISLHVSFTLPGHPELISTTFEHIGADGSADTAPTMELNPLASDPSNATTGFAPSAKDFLLYRAGTPANQANASIPTADLRLDEATQSFGAQTSIYRMFPASKFETLWIDDDLASLNQDVAALFARHAGTLETNDRRARYHMVGGIWLDKPSAFAVDKSLQNDLDSPFVVGPHINQAGMMEAAIPAAAFTNDIQVNGSDSEWSIQGGQDRLSSTTVESFTQAPGSFNNCLTCHNTQAVSAHGIPLIRDASTPVKLLSPSLLNVSRVFFQLVREECFAPANVVVDGGGAMTAVCP